jgi:hypothetical protein
MCRLENRAIPALFLVALLAVGCGAAATPDTRSIQTQVAASVFATQTADVPSPTMTPDPTNTPRSTLTAIPSATPTAVPTSTPTVVPTDTPRPTATPDAFAGIPARGRYSHTYVVKEEFDRFKNQTSVDLVPKTADYRRGPNNLSVSYEYAGTTPAIPPFVSVWLVYQADTWEYLKCYGLTWLLDGRTTLSPKTNHEGDVGRGYVLEIITSLIPVSQFLQIVNAKTVEGKLCNTEFALTIEQMEALRDVASRMRRLLTAH